MYLLVGAGVVILDIEDTCVGGVAVGIFGPKTGAGIDGLRISIVLDINPFNLLAIESGRLKFI
jgi:hypothetical protein